MKRQLLIIGLLVISSMMTMAQEKNNKYTKEWTLIEQYEKDDLPQSAAKEVDLLLKRAIVEKNTTQVIKLLICKNKYKKYIDQSDNEGIFIDLKDLLSGTKDVKEKALLASMLGELYENYYSNDMWNIRERTNILDVTPEDMKEWTANIFENQIISYLDQSVKDKDVLKQYSPKEYSDLIILGEDSKIYYPTLYDFLMERAIRISEQLIGGYWNLGLDEKVIDAPVDQLLLPANEFVKVKLNSPISNKYKAFQYYQIYLDDLLTRNMTPTLIRLDLERIDKVIRLRSQGNNGLALVLKNLFDEYKNDETSVEIINKIVDATSSNEKKYEWCKIGIDRYPNYKRIDLLKDQLKQLTSASLTLLSKPLFYPDSLISVKLQHRNLQSLEKPVALKLFKIANNDSIFVKSFEPPMVSKNIYESDSKELELGKFGAGHYSLRYLDSVSDSIISRYDFDVSSLTSFSRNKSSDEYEIIVVDRITGKPIEGALVKIYPYRIGDNRQWSYAETPIVLTTDKMGFAVYENNIDNEQYTIAQYSISTDRDQGPEKVNLYRGYSYNYSENTLKTDEINVFTDRSIYRPGQTVFFKAIIVDAQDKLPQGKEFFARLFDPNNELVSDLTLTTNEFGSVFGNFILPQSGLTGGYYVKVGNTGIALFQVEEYKRPTFDITFDKVDKTYSLDEEVIVRGHVKNFSGISLQDADVEYTIQRSRFSFWRSDSPMNVENDIVTTNSDGSFEITFTPEADIDDVEEEDSDLRIINPNIYRFTINAKVTDLNGETQTSSYSLTVGNTSMLVDIDMPEKVEKNDKSVISIGAMNLDGQKIETSGSFEIYTMDGAGKKRNKVLEGKFSKTGEQSQLKSSISKLPSGKYLLQINALDNKGKEVTAKKDFLLYSFKDKMPPVEGNDWFVVKNDTISKGRNAEILYGVTDKNVFVLYQVYNNKKIYERKYVKLNRENKMFTIPFREEYTDDMNVSFTLIRNDKFVNNDITIHKIKEVPDTELKLKFTSFRDRLRPGQDETWTISVLDKDGKAVQAEVLASMYDTSLDKLYPMNHWSFKRPYISAEYQTPMNFNFSNRNYQRSYRFNISDDNKQFVPIKPLYFDRLNWFGYFSLLLNTTSLSSQIEFANGWDADGNIGVLNEQVVMAYGIERKKSLTGSVAGIAIRGIASADADLSEEAIPVMPDSEIENNIPQIRQNLNETAFFYPKLVTNDNGETLLSFVVPESNTTWRFRALAHDKQLRSGSLEQMVVTRKELMVTPNLPRFVRQGDKTSISAKISNLSENALTGKVKIEFFDPSTDKLLNTSIENQEQIFSLEKDASSSATWTFDVPSNIDLIGCRIVAQSESFSDGEQHVLAVLPNRMLVTESMPINYIKGENNTFVFDKLYNNQSSSLSNYKLTLEFTGNPAWYAVQALPTLSNPTNENAVNWFASYYVNSLGASIISRYPKVSNMINNWKKLNDTDKQILSSKLQSNQELKSILLEETPWVLDAKDETEQMQRLSLLFDLNNAKQLTSSSSAKLIELQTPEGGWSWYKGMSPSRSITQYILYGYAELQLTGQIEYSSDIKTAQIKALQYLDSQIADDYTRLQKGNKNWEKITSISTSQLEYLYVRSFYRDIPIDSKTREAERFYTKIVTDNWTKTDLYSRALLVVLLDRNGENAVSDKIVKSLRERAVVDKVKGMYWPNISSNVFMSQSAVSIHTFLMDAMKESGAASKEMDMMKRWLLAQKQTQQWETTHATIDAINILLNTGSDWFSDNNQSPLVKVGQDIIDPAKDGTLGTDYIKKTWQSADINKDMANVEIMRSSSDQPAYGALYWQYYEDMDKILASENKDLSINKGLFKEILSGNDKVLTEVTTANPLNIGDKVVVRLTIRTNRDLDFVQLKDMRPTCFEPVNVLSGFTYRNSLSYYQSTKDASTNFYFDFLPKGTYVLEYPVYVSRMGVYSGGIATIECAYASEFRSHTTGVQVRVIEKN